VNGQELLARPGLRLVTKRWAPEILLELSGGPLRFNRLLQMPGISDRILFIRLTELIDANLVARHVHAGPPVRVTYSLTEAGRRYVEPMRQLQEVAVG